MLFLILFSNLVHRFCHAGGCKHSQVNLIALPGRFFFCLVRSASGQNKSQGSDKYCCDYFFPHHYTSPLRKLVYMYLLAATILNFAAQ